MAQTDGPEADNDADAVTAGILVIGDEILSGRTKDTNSGHIAEYLTQLGIDTREIRMVPDIAEEIIDALNALRRRYSYVFTTGGIGPTHDDITADAVAATFGVPIDVDPRAVAELLKRLKPEDLNEARLRMARIPEGGELIENTVSRAPGFRLGNVFVMAGIPSVMKAMLDAVAPTLVTGRPLLSRTIETNLQEGAIAQSLGSIAKAHPDVMIGSYPGYESGGFRNRIVVRGRVEGQVELVSGLVDAMLAELSASVR